MFSFKKKKKKEISLGEELSSVAAAVSTLCATAGIMLDRPFLCGANNVKREAAIMELKRLKQDHWDKDAFDRVIKFICEI